MRASFEKLLPLIVSIFLVGSLLILYFSNAEVKSFLHEGWDVLTSNNQAKIEAWIQELSYWGPVIILTGFVIQMFAFVIPSWLLIVVSILTYGPLHGSALAMAGIVLASSLGYAIGAYLNEYTLQKMLGEESKNKMSHYLERYGFWLVALFRFAPFLSNDTISFVAGLSTMRFKRFITATIIGITPLIAFTAYLGESNERLKEGFTWTSIICLAGFGLYVWWDRKQSTTD